MNEQIDTISKLVYLTVVLIATVAGLYFLYIWQRDRKTQRSREEELLRRQETLIFEQKKEQQYQTEDILQKLRESTEQQMSGVNSGGFIILELPEEQRGIFHDLLKGFEDYAKLRGYTIYFSVDNSMPHKIAFKFTIRKWYFCQRSNCKAGY